VIEMTFIPAVRVLMPPPASRERLRSSGERRLGAVLAGLADLVIRRPGAVLAIAAVLVAVALPGTRLVHVDNSLPELFPPSSAMRRDDAVVNARFAATSTMRILVEGDADGVIEEPEVLRAIDDLQRMLERDPQVGATTSIVD
jgi:predicted RND superfamily exporter protein